MNVTVSGDTSIEANETLQLVLSTLSAGGRNVSFSGGSSSLTGTGTINNDDSETLTISSPSVIEGNSGTVNMVFTVTSPLAVQGGFTVAFTLADVTTNSTDHAAFPTGPLNFAGNVGETQTITVVVNGDNTIEPNETLTATLGTVIAATATQSSAISTGAVGTGTIVNDDGNPPTATVNSDPVIVNEGSVATNGGAFNQVDGHAVTVAVAPGSPGIVSQIGTSTGSWSWSFTPPDGPSTQTVTINFTDNVTNLTTAKTFTLNTVNVPPTIAISGNAHTPEGAIYFLALGAITDPGTDTVSQWTVHWGDGQTSVYTAGGLKSHIYADGPSLASITVDLTDEDGTFTNRANPLTVTVDNVPPTIALTGNATVNEGSSYSLTLGAITDPGPDTVTGYTVHWGDGATTTASGNPTGQVLTHTYADGPSTPTITVDLTDEDGPELAAGTKTITVNNVPPTIAISGAASVAEGSSYSLTLGTITDPGQDTVTQWIVHWGDGVTSTFNAGGVQTHTYADGPATENITVDLKDEDGTFTSVANALSVSVTNVAPTLALTGNATATQNTPYSLTLGPVTDPGTDTVD